MENQESVLNVIKLLFAALGVIAIVYFVLIPLLRIWRAKPDLDILNPDFTMLDEQLEGEELQIPSSQQKPGKTELLNLARNDPRATAMIISKWVRERK